MRHLSLGFLGVAVAFGLMGCGAPTSPPLKDIGPATGAYKPYTAEKYGITIGVAPNFKIGSGHVADVKSSMDGMGAPSGSDDIKGHVPAELEGTLDQMAKEDAKQEQEYLAKMESDGIIIRAFQLGGQTFGEDMTKYEVRIAPNPSSSLEDAAKTLLEHVPGEEAPVPMQLPIGPAMHIVCHKKMTDGGEVYSSKYVLQDGKTMIEVLFLTEGEPTALTSIEKNVMDSLRVVPGKAVPPKPNATET